MAMPIRITVFDFMAGSLPLVVKCLVLLPPDRGAGTGARVQKLPRTVIFDRTRRTTSTFAVVTGVSDLRKAMGRPQAGPPAQEERVEGSWATAARRPDPSTRSPCARMVASPKPQAT